MKILTTLLTGLCLTTSTLVWATESKRTADYILTTPLQFEGKNVDLDVAFVKPVHWKSPDPDISFFHAMTVDRHDKKRAGVILVAIPTEEAAKFARRYGTDFDGRGEYDKLSGILTTAPGKKMKSREWIIDTTGKVAELVKSKKLVIDNTESKDGEGKAETPRP